MKRATPSKLRLVGHGQISIHAPMKGATSSTITLSPPGMEFQSTLPRRERHHRRPRQATNYLFQSTLPRRERPPPWFDSPKNVKISIHAPTKGATDKRFHSSRHKAFQSTLPRRERPFKRCAPTGSTYFNPRSHEGSDSLKYHILNCMGISIHAPTKGATYRMLSPVSHIGISIHAPTKGATSFLLISTLSSSISIHAPTKGATLDCQTMEGVRRFQSTLPRRERPSRNFSCASANGISIHAPTKGATTPAGRILTPRLFQSTLPRRERL